MVVEQPELKRVWYGRKGVSCSYVAIFAALTPPIKVTRVLYRLATATCNRSNSAILSCNEEWSKRWPVRIFGSQISCGYSGRGVNRPFISIYSWSEVWMESQLQSHTRHQDMEKGNINLLYLPSLNSTNNEDLIIRCITIKTQLYYHTVIKYYVSVHTKATCFGRKSAIIRPIQNIQKGTSKWALNWIPFRFIVIVKMINHVIITKIMNLQLKDRFFIRWFGVVDKQDCCV